MTLTLQGTDAWIACKEQSRLVRVNAQSGKTTKTVRLGGPVIAIRSGFASVWALDSSATLYRLNPRTAKVVKRIPLPARAPYNIWMGGGSVWVADDRGASVLRISRGTNKVVARIVAGDGPASMAFHGASAWVVNHRDTTVYRIDLAKNKSTLLARLGGAGDRAPERMVWLRDSLWITGRGTDLLEVSPADGSIRRTIEIGASGIDLVANGSDLWVPTRSAEVDPTGFPTMDALKRVSPSRDTVTTVAKPTSRLDVHGLAAANRAIWIADNQNGYLYRVPAG
jgi:hypothetical protein